MYMINVSTNVYAKFRCAPMRIKKAFGICIELATTTRTEQLEWLFGTRLPGPTKIYVLTHSLLNHFVRNLLCRLHFKLQSW